MYCEFMYGKTLFYLNAYTTYSLQFIKRLMLDFKYFNCFILITLIIYLVLIKQKQITIK